MTDFACVRGAQNPVSSEAQVRALWKLIAEKKKDHQKLGTNLHWCVCVCVWHKRLY